MRLDANDNDDHCPGTHPASRKNYSSTEANISLRTLSSSRRGLNAASLERRVITDRHFAPSIRPIYPNRWSFCIFSSNHMQQVRERQWRLPFVHSFNVNIVRCELLICASSHGFEWCSACLMNRISFHWSRSWINIFFSRFLNTREKRRNGK